MVDKLSHRYATTERGKLHGQLFCDEKDLLTKKLTD